MKLPRYFLAVVVGCLSSTAGAQQVTHNVAGDSATVATEIHGPRASTLDRPSDAVHRNAPPAPLPLPATGANLGEAKAEMAVGGAAIVVGALIGGDGGRVLMFGGAIVGLYGLWNYLK